MIIPLFTPGAKMADFGIMSWYISFGDKFGASIISSGLIVAVVNIRADLSAKPTTPLSVFVII